MEVRLEDLGKMMLKEAPILESNIILNTLDEYFNDTKNRMYLLYGRTINYFTVIQNNSMLSVDSAKKFVEFIDDSIFYLIDDEKEMVYQMNEIVEIEYNKDIKAVELWIGRGNPQYFQLMAWDDSSVQI